MLAGLVPKRRSERGGPTDRLTDRPTRWIRSVSHGHTYLPINTKSHNSCIRHVPSLPPFRQRPSLLESLRGPKRTLERPWRALEGLRGPQGASERMMKLLGASEGLIRAWERLGRTDGRMKIILCIL